MGTPAGTPAALTMQGWPYQLYPTSLSCPRCIVFMILLELPEQNKWRDLCRIQCWNLSTVDSTQKDGPSNRHLKNNWDIYDLKPCFHLLIRCCFRNGLRTYLHLWACQQWLIIVYHSVIGHHTYYINNFQLSDCGPGGGCITLLEHGTDYNYGTTSLEAYCQQRTRKSCECEVYYAPASVVKGLIHSSLHVSIYNFCMFICILSIWCMPSVIFMLKNNIDNYASCDTAVW